MEWMAIRSIPVDIVLAANRAEQELLIAATPDERGRDQPVYPPGQLSIEPSGDVLGCPACHVGVTHNSALP